MGNHFRGWYFKCQSPTQTLALIPAVHTHQGKRSCSIQIAEEGAHWNIPLSGKGNIHWDQPLATLGNSYFSPTGIQLDLQSTQCRAVGELHFGPPAPLPGDIMGPFRFVPFLECRHRVFSMRHQVTGQLRINERFYHFDHDLGYIEGDQGRSFPQYYIWTQCLFPESSLMLSAAHIPFGSFSFPGVIAALSVSGKTTLLATYHGARLLSVQNGKISIQQNTLLLTAELLSDHGRTLQAPQKGAMSRTIRENLSCHARYQLFNAGHLIGELESHRASFEYEYPC